MPPNIRKLHNTLKYIEEHPKEWNQRDWVDDYDLGDENRGEGKEYFCGTRFCFAGFVIARSKRFKFIRDRDGKFLSIVRRTGDMRGEETPRGTFRPSEVAAVELGLTEVESDFLFRGGNDLDDLREAVRRIAAGEYRNQRGAGVYYTQEIALHES